MGFETTRGYGPSLVARLSRGALRASRRQISALGAKLESLVTGLNPRTERFITIGLVAGVHLMAVVAIISGLLATSLKPPSEIHLVLVGGPPGYEKPRSILPTTLANIDWTGPELVVEDTSTLSAPVQDMSGSREVTRPAEAVADSHDFPALPLNSRLSRAAVRLLLSISETGAVTDSQLITPSGDPTLDELAMDWVKAHWRYRPALQNGLPVAVRTLALVTFVEA